MDPYQFQEFINQQYQLAYQVAYQAYLYGADPRATPNVQSRIETFTPIIEASRRQNPADSRPITPGTTSTRTIATSESPLPFMAISPQTVTSVDEPIDEPIADVEEVDAMEVANEPETVSAKVLSMEEFFSLLLGKEVPAEIKEQLVGKSFEQACLLLHELLIRERQMGNEGDTFENRLVAILNHPFVSHSSDEAGDYYQLFIDQSDGRYYEVVIRPTSYTSEFTTEEALKARESLDEPVNYVKFLVMEDWDDQEIKARRLQMFQDKTRLEKEKCLSEGKKYEGFEPEEVIIPVIVEIVTDSKGRTAETVHIHNGEFTSGNTAKALSLCIEALIHPTTFYLHDDAEKEMTYVDLDGQQKTIQLVMRVFDAVVNGTTFYQKAGYQPIECFDIPAFNHRRGKKQLYVSQIPEIYHYCLNKMQTTTIQAINQSIYGALPEVQSNFQTMCQRYLPGQELATISLSDLGRAIYQNARSRDLNEEQRQIVDRDMVFFYQKTMTIVPGLTKEIRLWNLYMIIISDVIFWEKHPRKIMTQPMPKLPEEELEKIINDSLKSKTNDTIWANVVNAYRKRVYQEDKTRAGPAKHGKREREDVGPIARTTTSKTGRVRRERAKLDL